MEGVGGGGGEGVLNYFYFSPVGWVKVKYSFHLTRCR